MKEIIQLNLTEEESIILQSLVAVGISIHFESTSMLERETRYMEFFTDKWPEASESLAEKMTDLVKVSAEMLEAK